MLKIVLSNDAELLLMLERSVLTRDDVALAVAADPVDLLDRVTADPPAMVLLGRRVGDTSGVELSRRLKADPNTAGVPIVLLDTPDPGIPADICLAPPIDRDELLRAVCELLVLARRSATRVRSRLRVEYFGDREGVGYTKDLSAGGAFMRTRDPLEPGAELQLIFQLPGEETATIRAGARVSRAVEHDSDSHLIAGVGVEFVRMSERDRAKIRRFVDRGGVAPVV